MAITDLTGQVFNSLTVLRLAGRSNRGLNSWVCRCICGVIKTIQQSHLRSGSTKSCGCQLGTHRLSKTDEYHIWQTMKARCYNPNNHKYKRYGGRGIAVCDRWLQSFENFIADMGKRPSTSHSLDRINNDGDYTPQNCRWATPKEQARNTQTNRLITLNGVTRTLVEWREYYGLSVTQLEYRMYHAGWSAEKALTTPYIRYQRLATCKGTEIK